jgi:hypothetical protein
MVINTKPFGIFNINGIKVEVIKMESTTKGLESWFCAYAVLKNSNVLSDSFLGHPTFREGDKVGVDTAHVFNEGQKMEEKLASALHQIEGIIEAWKSAIGGTD